MPVRKIPKNYNNITGMLSSDKVDRMIAFESKLERDYFFLFDFDPDIIHFEEQPVTIEYEFDGKRRKYTPDVLLTRRKEPTYIIGEIKYRDELKEKFDELRPKFEAAIAYCEQHDNMIFRLFTDRSTKMSSKTYMDNVRFLLAFSVINPDHKALILSEYSKMNTVTELLNKISSDKMFQMEVVTTLWALVRHQMIEVDMFSKLTANTVLIQITKVS